MRIRWRSDISEAEHRLVYDHHAWNILGIDAIGRREFMDLTVRTEIGGVLFLPPPFNVKAGLSDDAIPTAAEFTIDHTTAYIAFPAFTDKHILLWRDALEPHLGDGRVQVRPHRHQPVRRLHRVRPPHRHRRS